MPRLKASEKAYTPDSSPETAFNRIVSAHVERERKLIKEINWLRIFNFISWLALLASIIGWYQTKNMPKTVPLVVEVSEFGVPRYVGKIETLSYEKFQPKEYMIKAQLSDFVQYTREIILDSDVMYKDILKTFGWVSLDLKQRLNEEIQERDPFSQVGRIKVTVIIESIIPSTNNTWQVDWVDQTTSMNGDVIKEIKYRGLFTIQQQEPKGDKERERNPLGIYITDYNIVELKKPE